MRIDESQLEDLIVDSGVIDKEGMKELRIDASEKGTSLGMMAINKGVISDADLRRMEAYLLGVPFVDLKNRQIDFAIFSLIPEPVARNHNVVAFGRDDDALEVALLDIADLAAVEFLRQRGLRILPRFTDTESMRHALVSYQHALKSEFGDNIQEEVAKLKERQLLAPQLADALLKHALLQSATDIHIEPTSDHSLVRYRIGSFLRDAMILPVRAVSAVARTMRELAGIGDDDTVREGRFRLETGSENILCRFSLLPVEGGERITIRLVRSRSAGFTLEGLGLGPDAVEELHHSLFSGPGLVMAAGPAKSGKTTALYTMLDLLNSPEVHIATLEDEIEARLPRITQSQVRPETGFTYAHGLRTLLQQDPDVLMVGKIADRETASLVAEAAKRHLILTSLEADSPEAALREFSFLAGAPLHLNPVKMVVFHAPPALAGIKRAVLGQHMLQSLHGKADTGR